MVELLFGEQIERQSVFSTPAVMKGLLCLAVRNKDEVFVAFGNVIRCCQINALSTDYHIIEQKGKPFNIKTMQFNRDGLMLFIRSDTDLAVITLPSNIWSSTIVKAGYYQFPSFENGIKKVLWHPISSGLTGLVVLTGNVIQYYSVFISTETPRTEIDLLSYENFLGRNATSITFGSESSFEGATSLYVTSDKGDVFVIGGFIGSNGPHKMTKTAVNEFYKRSLRIYKNLEQSMPYDSPLNNAAHLQLEVAKSMNRWAKKQPSEDVMFVEIDLRPSSLLSVGLVDGLPLDTVALETRGSYTALAILVKKGPSTSILYHITTGSSLIVTPDFTKSSSQVSKAYSKPKKGFGFVDEDESLTDQYELWNEKFNLLRFAANDVISQVNTDSLIQLNGNSFAVKVDKVLVYADLGRWILSITTSYVSDPENIKYKFFKLSSSTSSVALVTGGLPVPEDYILAFDASSEKTSVQLLSIGDENKPKITKQRTESEPPLKPPVSALKTPPFEEVLTAILPSIQKDKSHLTQGVSQNILLKQLTSDIHSLLREASKVSENVISASDSLSKAMLQIQLRIDTQVADLVKQVSSLDSATYLISDEHLGIDEKRIESIQQRQLQLTKRQEDLQERLVKNLTKWKLGQDLPLSKSEKLWFREINSLNTKLNKDTQEGESIVKKVNNLQTQFKELRDRINQGKPSDDDLSHRLNALKLQLDVSKYRIWLEEESKSLKTVQVSMEGLVKGL